MKLKRITIHNIASITDAEIDFLTAPLAEAPLFLITGPTGAGKSTILDAVCLALYAKTPRMSRIKTNESYDDLSVGNTEKSKEIGVNSNTQLMRRSSGECFARLLFEGNDGNDYEAEWQLQRARKKSSGNMQAEKRKLTLIKSGEEWKNKGDVEERIREVVGLKYEQFCRTTLLAQGEFTRFLQCKSDEKSEILERLTGIDIYSAVGRKIADHAKAANEAYERAHLATEGITLLTEEEKTEIAAKIEKQQKRINDMKEELSTIDAKQKWLADDAKYAAQCSIARKQAEETAAIKISEEFIGKQRLVADFDRSASARVYLSERTKALAAAAAIREELPKQELQHQEATTARQLLEKEVELAAKAMELPTARLVKIDKPGLDRRQKALYEAKTLAAGLAGQRKLIADHNERVAECQKMLDSAKARTAAEQAEYEAADRGLRDCTSLYAQMEISIGNAAKELRHSLTVGAECPVCGHRIDSLPSDEHFLSVLEPVRKRKEASEERLRKAFTALKLTQSEITKQTSELAKASEKSKKAKADHDAMAERLSAACRATGISADLEAIDNALATVDKLQQEASRLQDECNTLRKRYDNLVKQQAAAAEAQSHIEKTLTERRTAFINAQKAADTASEALRTFLLANPTIDENALLSLSKLKPSEVESMRKYCTKIITDSDKCAGALTSIEKLVNEHRANRPALSEEETTERLQTLAAAKRAECDTLLQENAVTRKRLDDDSKQAATHAAAVKAEEEARTERDRWAGLSTLLGDNDGKRFRTVAQSFILSHLLNIANGYLSRFSDRYTLTCQPGSLLILVADAHGTGTPQSANILSGGESFMVSLSLALALSRLNAADTGVDTLFIDEGFGTLSDDCLTNVMDTLEALHQMGGRRVGIISHVDELASRIPVQIRVERVDATRSEATVINTCDYAD